MTFRIFAFLTILITTVPALAQTEIEFPQEELARESVLPKFDRPDVILDRHVVTKNRLELNAFGGWILTDPFWNSNGLGGSLSYHFTETQGFNLMGYYRFQGQSSQAEQIDSNPQTNIHLDSAPEPSYLVLASYQFTAFYGKMSITKSIVANFSTFALAGLGVYSIGDSTNPTAGIGIGQKYYLTPSFALRWELREIAYQGPDIMSRTLTSTPTPASSFDQKMLFDTFALIGASYLLPAF